MNQNILFRCPVTAVIATFGVSAPKCVVMKGENLAFEFSLAVLDPADSDHVSVKTILENSRGLTFERLERVNQIRLRVFTGTLFELINSHVTRAFGTIVPHDLRIRVEGLHPLFVQSLISRICAEHKEDDQRFIAENLHPLPGFHADYEDGKLVVSKLMKFPCGNKNAELVSLGSVFPRSKRSDSYSSPVVHPIRRRQAAATHRV
ncbi:MAG: hypothetical protein WCO18_00365 [bacterium]